MRSFLLSLAVCAFFLLGRQPLALAQPSSPEDQRGSNYDPPQQPKAKPAPRPVTEPEPEKPLIAVRELDWSDKETWMKAALLVGSVLLARRAFKQMKDDY